MEEKLTVGQKVKGHFKKHKDKYITGCVCTVAGVSIGVMCGDSIKNKVINMNIFVGSKDISVINNNITELQLKRRGHPGYVIKCNETGEVFASQRRACDLLGISRASLAKHLKGENEHASGYTFENLGEAQ